MEDHSQHTVGATGQPVRRACTFCQNRHLKCDGTHPCHQCERRGKECVFMPLVHTKRVGVRRGDQEEEHGAWRGAGEDSQADGGVFALDGDDDLDVPGSYKKRKRKANLSSMPHSYMDEDMDQKDAERPGRYALPAAAAILSAASSSNHTSMNHPLVLGNGNGLKHNLSDSALDASAALSQLSSVAASNRNGGTTVAGGTGFGSAFSSNATFSGGNASPGASGPGSKTVAATNAWMIAFAQGVSPFTSSAPFTPLEPLELQRILSLDMEQLHSLAPELLARALMQCAMLAHGSRYTGNLETSAQHGWKAWQLVKVCVGRKRVHTISTLAQTLVSSLELLAYYFLGTSDFFKVRTVVHHAYHVFVNHRHFLADSTAHRVLGLMIGASCSIEDTEFWLAKAKALNLQATTPYETSGWVVLALMLSSGVIGTGDRDILPSRTKQLQDRDFSHKMSILHVIDESDKAVAYFEATPTCLNDVHSQKVCKIHKAVLDGCRALILWQCGFDKEASTSVMRVLAVGKPSEVSRLPHLMSLCWCTQIARQLNMRAAYTKGIEYLDEGTFSYAYIRMLSDELKKPVSLSESLASEDAANTMMSPDDGNGSTSVSTPSGAALTNALGGAPNNLFKSTLPSASVFSRSGSGSFTSKLGTSPSLLSSGGPSRLSLGVSSGGQTAGDIKMSVFGGSGPGSAGSPRTDEEAGMNGITPMRPNPMKVTTVSSIFSRNTGGAAQSVSPQMQSVSPQLSMSPHHLQGVSPHLLQGVSPLAQGLSPFTTLGGTPLIQPHLMPHLNQFSPQIPSFLGVGSTFSPGALQSTSPGWAGASTLNSEYLMDSSEPNQWN